jgi:hypothetical protein
VAKKHYPKLWIIQPGLLLPVLNLILFLTEFGGPNLMFGENKEKIQDLKKRLRILGDFL